MELLMQRLASYSNLAENVTLSVLLTQELKLKSFSLLWIIALKAFTKQCCCNNKILIKKNS
jgi:hypothetical protein